MNLYAEHYTGAHILCKKTGALCGWMDEWVGEWMGGLVDGEAGLRIAYSNKKLTMKRGRS